MSGREDFDISHMFAIRDTYNENEIFNTNSLCSMKLSMSLDTLPIETVLRKRKSLRRELLTRLNLHELRIAVLGGSTTNELVDLLEILLLDNDFKPVFYQSEYNRY